MRSDKGKGVDKRIDEDVIRWFDHVERMEDYKIAKKAYVLVVAQ